MIISALAQRRGHRMTEVKRLMEMVVDVVSNDYESYDNVLKEVAVWANEENIEWTDQLIGDALRQAIEQGLVQAFSYSEQRKIFVVVGAGALELPHLYFLATAQGRKLLV